MTAPHAPAGAVWRESRGNLPEDLYPVESTYISRAVPKRVDEFCTVRRLARDALAEFGVRRPPMVPGDRGQPTWPEGIVGAITHCTGYRAVVVARRFRVMGIGIDAEPNLPLPDRIVGRIASPREIERVTALRRQRPDVCADRLLFSAKESVYKVWYPRERTMLDFHQAEIDLRPDGRFSAVISPHVARRLAGRRAPEKMTGHWDLDRGVLRTSVAVLAGETPAPESRTTSFDRGSTHDHHRD